MPARVAKIFRHEAAPGVLLMAAAALALVVANSPLYPAYEQALDARLSVSIGDTGLAKPVFLWINDGLMAVFFFLIGLELKREMLEGKLRNPRDVFLPGMAAVGGMAVPALIFAALNLGQPTISGWAIPAATDIAFALGVLAMVGKRAPPALKLFLLTLAILDDLGAIVIIALFYTHGLNLGYLAVALLPLAGLVVLNLAGVGRMAPSIMLGAILWLLVLKSGMHATLAGVITAFLIPLTDRQGKSPLNKLEHALAPYVNFLIVPLFAFANAGVVLSGLTAEDVFSRLTLGIALGLVVGKLAGVYGTTWAMVRLGHGGLPEGTSWRHIGGLGLLAGVGFTMSLFIGGLSFDGIELMNQVRLGVLAGSVVAAVAGYVVLVTAPAVVAAPVGPKAPPAEGEAA